MNMKLSIGNRIFNVFNHCCILLFSLTTVYPFIYVLSASISSPQAVITGKVLLFPKGITLEAYKYLLEERGIWMAYANTIFYTVVGTAVQMFVTTTGAYALSKKRLLGRSFISFMLAFTMWFHAGMIPFFLNIKDLGLYNNRWGIIIAFACTAFYVILMRTYFQSISESLEESAIIDGANDFTIFSKIYLPLSVPTLATIGLYYAVSRWNAYFWAMVLLRDESKIPLQVLLRKLVIQMKVPEEYAAFYDVETFTQETFIYSTIMVSVIPIVMVYPFLQKHFVKGIMMGAIKG